MISQDATPAAQSASAGVEAGLRASDGLSTAGATAVRAIPVAGFAQPDAIALDVNHVSDVYRSALARGLKRSVDVAGAAVALVLSAPVMLISAVLIKLESNGPVVFRQERIGRDGQPFTMLKLRTMCAGAETLRIELKSRNEMSGPTFKIRRDPRVTATGRFLRKYSIDELPQLLHVLSGKLSLVGPRPALPSEVAQYEAWHAGRLRVKPGLTCLWQVNGRNQVGFDEWMRLDMQYIRDWSLWLDLKILCRTIPTVLRGTGV